MKFMKAEANLQEGRFCCTVSPLSCRQYTSKCPKSLRSESLLFATQQVKAEAPFSPISAQIFPWNFRSTGWPSYKAGFHSNPACLSSQKCYSPFKNAQTFLSSCRVSEDPCLPIHTSVYLSHPAAQALEAVIASGRSQQSLARQGDDCGRSCSSVEQSSA